MNWKNLDEQMNSFSAKLTAEVKLTPEMAAKLATTIAVEVKSLNCDQRARIKNASPVALEDRLSELQAFQGWMDYAINIQDNPFITRAQVITQNYICFVYLPESCFRILAKVSTSGSATRKCAKYLSNNPIRLFRNAVAHANWMYRADFRGIVYWSRKGENLEDPLERFEVEQNVLTFWQALSRCVAYAAFSSL